MLHQKALAAPEGLDSAITAATVKRFFEQLPKPVAEHAEGVQAIAQIMALFEKLHSAATTASASPSGNGSRLPAAAPAASEQWADLEFDDELLDDLAEAAIGGADEGDEESRARRLDAAKARLRSNGRGILRKVRKSTKS